MTIRMAPRFTTRASSRMRMAGGKGVGTCGVEGGTAGGARRGGQPAWPLRRPSPRAPPARPFPLPRKPCQWVDHDHVAEREVQLPDNAVLVGLTNGAERRGCEGRVEMGRPFQCSGGCLVDRKAAGGGGVEGCNRGGAGQERGTAGRAGAGRAGRSRPEVPCPRHALAGSTPNAPSLGPPPIGCAHSPPSFPTLRPAPPHGRPPAARLPTAPVPARSWAPPPRQT